MILLASLLVIKCTKSKSPRCEESISIFESNITFFLQNADGKSLIGDFNSTYSTDLVKITDYEGIDSVNYKIAGDGLVYINPSSITDKVGINLEKSFLIHLPKSAINPSEDIDTLNLKYNVINQCFTIWYDSISVYYNQKLIYNGKFPLEHLKITK